MTAVTPQLVAASDVLVLTALSRAYSRGIPRSARSSVREAERWRAYEQHPIAEKDIDAVLRDAWVLCPLLAARLDLDVIVADWVGLLDSYVRTLLMMSQYHAHDRLAAELARVPAAGEFVEATDADDWVKALTK